ncbi:MAG: FAD-binding oxidoreductase [Aequorivita sp.]
MKNFDYIIVGLGIAGISICSQLEKHGKTFVAIDNGLDGATAASGGVFNPTVLKRFTAAWNAPDFYPVARRFYSSMSKQLGWNVFQELPILRIFANIEEQNNWTVASDKKQLQAYLSPEFIKNSNPSIEAPNGFGKLIGTGKINTDGLLSGYKKHLKELELLIVENFEYVQLRQEEDRVVYKNLSAQRIIFCEGAKAVENPYFPSNAIIGNKGEYIIIRAPELNLQCLLKGSIYIIPLGNDLYKVGATYSRDDFENTPSTAARDEILSKLKSFINCPYEVVGQISGIRPTTKDHRPLLGNLLKDPEIIFYNGLGSRGFLMAPLLSEMLYNYLEENIPLPKEVNIGRMKF